MKKAKIFLSAFAVLALVAGALAFKANKFSGTVFCASTTGQTAGTTACPPSFPSKYELNPLGNSYCTVTNNTECIDRSDGPIPNN